MIKQRKRRGAKDTFRSFAVIMKLAFIRLLRAVSNTNRKLYKLRAERAPDNLIQCTLFASLDCHNRHIHTTHTHIRVNKHERADHVRGRILQNIR